MGLGLLYHWLCIFATCLNRQRLRFILLQEMRGGIESQSDWRKINHMTDKERYEELYKKYNILCEEYREL